MERRRERALRVALWLLLAGCASHRPPLSDALFNDDTGVLVPTERLASAPFTLVQRLHGKHGSEDLAFECVVQLAARKLTILGMTRHSPRAFVIEQVGVDAHVEKFIVRDVLLEPIQLLYDLHRLLFRGLPAPQRDGTHERLDHGQVVRELWRGGHIVQRSFHSLETFARLVVIDFEGAPAPVIAPRVRLENLHYGYSLEIANVEQRRLERGYSLDIEKLPTTP